MVIPTLIRCITGRSVLALLATTASVGLTSEAAAQYAGPAAIAGPVPEFNFLDVPLAEGERIISSTTSENGAVIQYGGGNYRMVDSSSVPTAASGQGHSGGAGMPSNVTGFPLTGHCASGNCAGGNCGTCGKQGGQLSHGGYVGPGANLSFGARGHQGTDLGGHRRVGAGGNVCGPTCNPYHYVAFDALYMANNGVNDYVAAQFPTSDYDYERGMRITIGRVPNCHNGHEASFVGPFRWRSESAQGGTRTLLTPSPGFDFPITGIDPNFYVTPATQFQRYEAEYASFEFNRTLIGWEVIKLLHGIRYIQYEEQYLYSAENALNSVQLGSETENRMIGLQVGIDMTYPLTCRLWSDFRARAGAYANFAENYLQFNRDNAPLFSNTDDGVKLAGVFEIGGGARYYLTNNFHIRGGGELWYMTQVASATDQFGRSINTGTGSSTDIGDDILMFGLSVGAEWRF
jgi:hypothetical protein